MAYLVKEKNISLSDENEFNQIIILVLIRYLNKKNLKLIFV